MGHALNHLPALPSPVGNEAASVLPAHDDAALTVNRELPHVIIEPSCVLTRRRGLKLDWLVHLARKVRGADLFVNIHFNVFLQAQSIDWAKLLKHSNIYVEIHVDADCCGCTVAT